MLFVPPGSQEDDILEGRSRKLNLGQYDSDAPKQSLYSKSGWTKSSPIDHSENSGSFVSRGETKEVHNNHLSKNQCGIKYVET